MGFWDSITGWFGGGTDDSETAGAGLPDTKEGCAAFGEKLVYWDSGSGSGECKAADNALIAKLNACNRSGSHFDFTANECKSNLSVAPRCGEGRYFHEEDGELGKCISREDLCKFKSVELSEGFAGQRARVYNEGAIFFYLAIALALGMVYMRQRQR
jgi:hypothetical protein